MNATHTSKDNLGSAAVLLTILLSTLTGVHVAFNDVLIAVLSLPTLV
jgi:hypothetical protein